MDYRSGQTKVITSGDGTPPMMSVAAEEEFIYLRSAAVLRDLNHRTLHERRDVLTDTTEADQLRQTAHK